MTFLVKLSAGLALIIFGVRFLRKGLDRLLGAQLVDWLEKATSNRARALGAGVVTGALAPSSTGLSLLTAQLLGQGKARAGRMLAVFLGANIGMTALANVVALHVGDYAGVLLFLGVLGFQFSGAQRIRGVGQCLLSLGFIFLAMNFLGDGAREFGRSHDVGVIFGVLDHHPNILSLAAAAIAIMLQSSTATVGVGIGLAAGGVLPNSLFVCWIVGTNIGLGATSLIVSRASLEGRRLGWANLIVKFVASAVIVAGAPRSLPDSIPLPMPQQLALMHTAFNVFAAAIAFPFLDILAAGIRRFLVTNPPAAENRPRSFLAPEALETPSIALAHATREALRMTDEVKAMLHCLWAARRQGSLGLAKSIHAQDDTVDAINKQLMLYLSQLGELNQYYRKWHFLLLSYSNELETIGDIIEKNLLPTVAKQLAERIALNPADDETLEELLRKTQLQFDLATSFIATRDSATSRKLAAARTQINDWCHAKRRDHYERLNPIQPESLASSLCFLDMLEGLRRVCEHLSVATSDTKPVVARPQEPRDKAARPGGGAADLGAPSSSQP